MIRDTAFSDIVTGNDPKVQKLELEGLAAADMSAEERAQLRRLIELYVGRVNARVRQGRADAPRSCGIRQGALCLGGRHRIRPAALLPHPRPTLLIEYDDTQNDANHIHTVYRDLERDFGGDALRAHYRGALSHR